MDVLKFLRDDHEEIEMELSELDFITKEEAAINYSNLVHTYWKVCELWNNHEKKEEGIFPIMKEEGFAVSVESLFLEHRSLRERMNKIEAAINSGSDFEVRKVLGKEVEELVGIMRKHMRDEEDVLAGVVTAGFSSEGREKIRQIILRG